MAEASARLAGHDGAGLRSSRRDRRDRRFIVAAHLTVSVAGYFWTVSRYPASSSALAVEVHGGD
jgi:hypothetical protein